MPAVAGSDEVCKQAANDKTHVMDCWFTMLKQNIDISLAALIGALEACFE
jgi:hypothetical protein